MPVPRCAFAGALAMWPCSSVLVASRMARLSCLCLARLSRYPLAATSCRRVSPRRVLGVLGCGTGSRGCLRRVRWRLLGALHCSRSRALWSISSSSVAFPLVCRFLRALGPRIFGRSLWRRARTSLARVLLSSLRRRFPPPSRCPRFVLAAFFVGSSGGSFCAVLWWVCRVAARWLGTLPRCGSPCLGLLARSSGGVRVLPVCGFSRFVSGCGCFQLVPARSSSLPVPFRSPVVGHGAVCVIRLCVRPLSRPGRKGFSLSASWGLG